MKKPSTVPFSINGVEGSEDGSGVEPSEKIELGFHKE
jgi:hypothetical protein